MTKDYYTAKAAKVVESVLSKIRHAAAPSTSAGPMQRTDDESDTSSLDHMKRAAAEAVDAVKARAIAEAAGCNGADGKCGPKALRLR